jgi:predicted regulator of Ras-like GTPase activity (Roadblock/LC7/MglB family)
MVSLEKPLSVVRDVPGVEGAFVVDELGALLALDGTLALPEAALVSAAARVATFLEAAAEGFEPVKEATLIFASHRLILRALSPCILAVLARTGANVEAVRMASNIALRQMVRQLGGEAQPSVTGLVRAPAAPSSGRVAATPSSGRAPVGVPLGTRASPRAAAPPSPAATPKKKPKNDIWG